MDNRQLPEWHDPLFDKPNQQPDPEAGKFAKAAFAMGVCSLIVLCVSGLSAFLGIGAVVCGIISKKRAEDGSGMATAGIIMGIISIGVSIILLCIYGLKFALQGVASGLTSVDDVLK